jgi:hypothetical protein
MPLLLPNLDDRSWADLADEGRSLIPVYGPEWTDHNASDPGITLVELLAWITEMDIFRLNQISDAERLKFLNLVGVRPRPPIPAWTILRFALKDPATSAILAESLEFSGSDANGNETRYQTARKIVAAAGALQTLQNSTASGWQNLTATWLRQAPIYPFGQDPVPGAAFYLGFSDPLPTDSPVSVYFTFQDGVSSMLDRLRIIDEQEAGELRCRQLQPENPCNKTSTAAIPAASKDLFETLLVHYGVRTVWEYLSVTNGVPAWVQLNPAKKEVADETRAFTLDGSVTFQVPVTLQPFKLGTVAAPLCYLRCRVDAGRFDAAPVLGDVAFNAVCAVQRAPETSTLILDSKCAITYGAGGAPTPGTRSTVYTEFGSQNHITKLDFTAKTPSDPLFTILDFQAPAGTKHGSLTLEAVFLGWGSGLPAQRVTLPGAPVVPSTLRLYTQEAGSWQAWELRQDFLASSSRDSDAVVDPTAGIILFGDGDQGRVPPANYLSSAAPAAQCLIFAAYETTGASNGNLAAGQINKLVDSEHNRALLYVANANPDGWTLLDLKLDSTKNPLPASGGADAETIAQAASRADQLVETTQRAVTLEDCERLAMQTPGTRIARVTARANLHPDFPCFKAPGLITVLILPSLPKGRPMPTSGLLRAVSAFLQPRRVIGTRVEVVGPEYLEVAVIATLQSKAGAGKARVQQAAVQKLNEFFDPLLGGPDGSGWPFGRDVYRAEVMGILNEISGVDHVTALELMPGHGPAQCGNVCLGPTWLVAAGTHQIQVL